MKKFWEYIENSLAVTTVVGITAISTFLVLGLSPRPTFNGDASVSDSTTYPNAVMFEDLSEDEKGQINITSVYSQPRHELVFDESSRTIKVSPKSLDNQLKADFFTIQNNLSKPVTIQVSNSINGYVLDSLSLKLLEKDSSYIIYTPSQGSQNVSITIPANSAKTFQIEMIPNARINFPFVIEIMFN